MNAGNDWLHEVKYDGYRMHARLVDGKAQLLTRTGLDWSKQYRFTIESLQALPVRSAYLDGELCAIGPDGVPTFSRLQAAMDERRTEALMFMAFDLLFLDGESTAKLPPSSARSGCGRCSIARFADCASPITSWVMALVFREQACKLGVEGVVSKRIDYAYAPGTRSLWLKSKCLKREEFVVVGWTDPRGGRSHFGALLLGYYTEDGRLLYAGRAGTGFTERELARPAGVLKPLQVSIGVQL
jgi:bifunctional non-homologous end joining protein LigD